MKTWRKICLYVLLAVMCVFCCVGYAALTDVLSISGNITVTPPPYDIYITEVTPQSSAGVTVDSTSGNVMFMEVDGSGTAKFTVNFVNISNKDYVYERVVDGAETNIEGVYNGTDITYTVSNVSALGEIKSNGGTLSLDVEIKVPSGVVTNLYVLKFYFLEKQGLEILPGQDEYAVTFKYNNNTSDKVVVVHENEFVPRPTAPTRVGYTFAGWYTDETFAKAWNFEADVVKGDMTLFAKWEKIPSNYRVTFVPNNGDSSFSVLSRENTLLAIPETPLRDGFVFIGWYKDSALTDAWNFDTDTVISDMTLYGGWDVYVPPAPPYLDITFKPNNGQEDTTVTVLTGEFIQRPETPVRDGYRFIGWYTDEACTNAWNFEASRPEWHMTLYGGWKKIIEYTVTLKLNNNMPDVTIVVEEGNLIPVPEAPTKEGYTFIGWYVDEGCTTAWNIDIDRPTSNITLYAGWQKNATDTENQFHGEFMGLVEALISKTSNCLNNSNAIFNAVMNSLNNGKRPDEDPPIVHCQVKSVPGGNMATIASDANNMLGDKNDYYFIFMAETDPEYKNNRLYLYMYYGSVCSAAKNGTRILVYKQILTRQSNGEWIPDGTFKGHAAVDTIYGGGNDGKDVKTVNPYTWMSGELPE